MATRVFNARLAQANLITKTDFDAKLSSLNRKITSNKAKQRRWENVIILTVDMTSSTEIYNKGKDILILGFGHTQG